jgi:hypothetical protein
MLAVVDRGTEVTVAISPSNRRHAALLYDPAAFRDDGLYAQTDGETEVTFRSCPTGGGIFGMRGPTQFNGGLIVDGRGCVGLDVLAAGAGQAHLVISVGHRSCPSAR